MGLAWWCIGLLCFLSIVFIPFGRACFVIGEMAFWPFGNEHVNRERLNRISDIGTGPLGFVGNVIWFVFAGFLAGLGSFVPCRGLFYYHHRHSIWLSSLKTGNFKPGAYRPYSGQ